MWPAAGGLEFGVLARRRRARFLRAVKCGPPQAGSVFTNSFEELGFIIVLKYPTLSIPHARPLQATLHVNALENAEGKGGKKERERVPGRTGRRSS